MPYYKVEHNNISSDITLDPMFENIMLSSMIDKLINEKFDSTWLVGDGGGSIYSTAAVVDGVAYFGCCDRNFYALDAETGAELWRFRTGGVILSSPAVDEGVVYFGSYDGNLYAVASATGKLLWRFGTSDMIASDPLVYDNKIYYNVLIDGRNVTK